MPCILIVRMGKKIFLAIIVGCFGLVSGVNGDVQFEIEYIDEPGTGFHIRPEAKLATEEAAAELGSWLEDEGVVRLAMSSIEGEEGVLAWVNLFNLLGDINEEKKFYHTLVEKKILMKEDGCLEDPHVLLTVNFGNKYAYFGEG